MINFKATEREIIVKLKDSDEESLAALYSMYAKRVFSLAVYILKDQAWSEDVVQEVFIHLWNSRMGLDEKKDIWLFLFIITKQKSLTKLRTIMRYEIHKQYHWNLINEACDLVDEEVAFKDLTNNLKIALDKLTPTQKQIFNLSRLEGLSHQEIAVRLSISTNTVKNHMVAALKRLRVYLQEDQFLELLIFLGISFFLV